MTDTHLVGTQGVGKHVAAACSQHVNLLTHIILQLLKLALRPSDLGLDLTTDRKHKKQDNEKHTYTLRINPHPDSPKQASSYLAELFQLFVGVWVQFLGDVFHPEQSSSVLGAGLLHTSDCQQRVGDGAPPERLHFLVQTVQWLAKCHPVEEDTVRGCWRIGEDCLKMH